MASSSVHVSAFLLADFIAFKDLEMICFPPVNMNRTLITYTSVGGLNYVNRRVFTTTILYNFV